MQRWKTLTSLAILAVISLSGCVGDDPEFDANRSFEETGNTVHLKMQIVDLFQHEVAPGLETNLWAFCAEPFDPNDEYSAAAIEHFTPLEGDAPLLPQELRETCSVPGPTLRVQQGDRVIVEFSHSHFHAHTIHWHGQFVPWEMDGAPGVTQDSVASGESITYDFIAKRAGTLWYHCHVDTQMHVMQGLYGAFIVEPQDDTYEPKDIDQDITWVLSTLQSDIVRAIPGVNPHSQHGAGCVSGMRGCENPPADVTPDTWMINGHSYPLTMDQPETMIKVNEGERIRLRLVNVGETFETMHPHGHDMLVTHRDGNPLPPAARFYVDSLTIGPAERYDVLIVADNPGPWMFHTHVNSHETTCGKSNGGMHSMIVYEGFKGHGFNATLAATCEYSEPVALPGDEFLFKRLQLPNGDYTETVEFPVVQACSVRSVNVEVLLDAENAALAALNTMDIEIQLPDGFTIASGAIGGSNGMNASFAIQSADVIKEIGEFDFPDRVVGDWKILLSGSAIASDAQTQIHVDYIESLEQSRAMAALYHLPICPGLTT